MLRREIGSAWGSRSIHEISKRDVIDVISAIEQRGAPIAANKTLKAVKTFFRWCVGRALLNQSPADGIPLPAKEAPRDRVLSDDELASVISAARKIGGAYGAIVEFLALTGQRREEVAQASWDEFDLQRRLWSLPNRRTKNGKPHTLLGAWSLAKPLALGFLLFGREPVLTQPALSDPGEFPARLDEATRALASYPSLKNVSDQKRQQFTEFV